MNSARSSLVANRSLVSRTATIFHGNIYVALENYIFAGITLVWYSAFFHFDLYFVLETISYVTFEYVLARLVANFPQMVLGKFRLCSPSKMLILRLHYGVLMSFV